MPDLGLGVAVNVNPPAGPTFTIAAPAAPTVTVLPVVGPRGPAGAGGEGAVTEYDVTAVTSFTTAHDFAHPPPVRFIDPDGFGVANTVDYPDSTHVHTSFPAPFTGTILIG